MRVAVVAEWYPSPADPVHGVWAHRQAVAARDAGAVNRVYSLIGELERSAFAAPRFEYTDRFVAFLVVGLLLWTLGRSAAATVWSGLP